MGPSLTPSSACTSAPPEGMLAMRSTAVDRRLLLSAGAVRYTCKADMAVSLIEAAGGSAVSRTTCCQQASAKRAEPGTSSCTKLCGCKAVSQLSGLCCLLLSACAVWCTSKWARRPANAPPHPSDWIHVRWLRSPLCSTDVWRTSPRVISSLSSMGCHQAEAHNPSCGHNAAMNSGPDTLCWAVFIPAQQEHSTPCCALPSSCHTFTLAHLDALLLRCAGLLRFDISPLERTKILSSLLTPMPCFRPCCQNPS